MKPITDPATARYSQASTGPAANESASSVAHSPRRQAQHEQRDPAAEPSRRRSRRTRRQGAATSGRGRSRSRPGDRRADHDQQTERRRRPGRAARDHDQCEPAEPDGGEQLRRRVRPARRTARRISTTCNGTEPAIIAATLESIRVSATCTIPTPRHSISTPSPAAAVAARRSTRSDRPETATIAASSSAATRKRSLLRTVAASFAPRS